MHTNMLGHPDLIATYERCQDILALAAQVRLADEGVPRATTKLRTITRHAGAHLCEWLMVMIRTVTNPLDRAKIGERR